jgi:hypothetical protein
MRRFLLCDADFDFAILLARRTKTLRLCSLGRAADWFAKRRRL